MGYTTGAKTLPDIMDEIANGLIGSQDTIDGLYHWTDADTTWNTSIRTAINARRALKYTKDTEVMYVALESRNTWYSSYGGHAAKGLRVTFSSSWFSNAPSGAIYQTSIPFDDYSGGAQPMDDFATLMITYYLWIESNGFALMAKPEPTTANQQNSFFLVVERNPNKFYVDNQSNFYCYVVMNMWPTFAGVGEPDRHYSFLRPFIYKFPTEATISDRGPNYYCMALGSFDRHYAFKSAGNGKVYYVKPVIFNDKYERYDGWTSFYNVPPSPIFQADLWFYWTENMGLVDGDIVAIEGATTKYLIKSLDSPDSTAKLFYAMKFVA